MQHIFPVAYGIFIFEIFVSSLVSNIKANNHHNTRADKLFQLWT